jgi:TonB-dependent receptor
MMEETSPKFGATLSDTFSLGGEEDVLGVAFSLSYYDREFGSENVETGGAWIFEDGQSQGVEEIQQRDYSIERERIGLGLNLDYKLSDTTDLYLRSLYSSFTDTETRQATITEWESVDDGGAGLSRGQQVDAAVSREIKNREEEQEMTSLAIGGSSIVDSWTIDYVLGYSKSSEDENMHIDGGVFEANTDIAVGFNNRRKPRINAGSDFYDASIFELDEVEMAEADTEDEQTSAKLDFSKSLELFSHPSQIKFGAKFTQHEKTANEDVLVYDGGDIGAGNPSLDGFNSGEVDYGIGRFGPGISASALESALNGVTPEEDIEGSNVADYDITEDINAAYAMVSSDINDWRIIAGVRYETTDIEANGNSYNADTDAVEQTRFTNDYSHVLPAILTRYTINEHMLLRAAWTNSIARPTFEQISPGIIEDAGDFEGGNPELDAMESSNIDVSFEFYPENISVASVGVFYKDIDNFIYATEIGNIETWDNGESASVYGLELNYVKSFESGFLISANTSFIDSEATVEKDGAKRDIRLPQQSDTLANLVLGYELDKLSLRLSGNYRSNALIEVNDPEEKYEDIYQDDSLQWDFVGRYKVANNLTTYFKVVNITDEPYYAYQYKSAYNAQYEEYGRTLELGIELSNF